MTTPDTSYHERRHEARMEDPEFPRVYELARAQMEQVDTVVRRLYELRADLELSKARLARAFGKNPAARRHRSESGAHYGGRTRLSAKR